MFIGICVGQPCAGEGGGGGVDDGKEFGPPRMDDIDGTNRANLMGGFGQRASGNSQTMDRHTQQTRRGLSRLERAHMLVLMRCSLGRDDDGCVNVLRNVERSSLHCLNR